MAYDPVMRFAAPWERMLKVSTALALLFMAAGALVLLRLAVSTEVPGATATGVVLVVALAATLVGGWALAPTGYSIEAGRLRILRPLRAIEVPLGSIAAAGPLAQEDFRGSVRVAGSSGLFGYYGRFSNPRLGSFRLYATRRTGLVLVETAKDRFVLSPEPPERFLEALRSRAPSAARGPGAAGGPPLPPRPMPRGVKIGLGILVALVPIVVGGVLVGVWAFTPYAARVEGGEIRIQRRLAPDAVIPLAEVVRVEPISPASAHRLGRVVGTAVPGGVRYGHFRSRELGDVQLYAWRSDGYVLVDRPGGRVVLTPDDADGFVQAVRAGVRR